MEFLEWVQWRATKMMRRLEHLLQGKTKFSPQGRVLRGWARFCLVVPSNGTRCNRQKLGMGVLYEHKHLYSVCDVSWNRLPRKPVATPSVEIFRDHLDAIVRMFSRKILPEQGWDEPTRNAFQLLPFSDSVTQSAQDLCEAQIWYYCFMTSNLIDSKGQLKYDNLIIVYSVNNSKVI